MAADDLGTQANGESGREHAVHGWRGIDKATIAISIIAAAIAGFSLYRQIMFEDDSLERSRERYASRVHFWDQRDLKSVSVRVRNQSPATLSSVHLKGPYYDSREDKKAIYLVLEVGTMPPCSEVSMTIDDIWIEQIQISATEARIDLDRSDASSGWKTRSVHFQVEGISWSREAEGVDEAKPLFLPSSDPKIGMARLFIGGTNDDSRPGEVIDQIEAAGLGESREPQVSASPSSVPDCSEG